MYWGVCNGVCVYWVVTHTPSHAPLYQEDPPTPTPTPAGTLTPTQGSITRHREALVGVFMQNDVDTMLAAAEQHTRNQHTKDQQPSPTRPTHTAGGSGSGGSGGQSATPTHQSAPPPQPLTVLSWLQQQHPHLREDDIRGRLNNQYGIKQGVATQPLLSLSGGQAVRVALCNVLIKAPQLLVLDEVTNHLDMDSVQGLAEALRGFTGGLVLVSHDQWFVQQVGVLGCWGVFGVLFFGGVVFGGGFPLTMKFLVE